MPQKAKRKTAKKVSAHHVKRLHSWRIAWFSGLAVSLLLVQGIYAAQNVSAYTRQPQVLAYATAVSRDGLLSATNAARAANGKAALALNSKLNNSSQAKANDMIAKDYWSHNAPDGTQPWYFFKAAGYAYTKAGENLAYGFDNSEQINDAWMNSSGHRANVLGDYKDVGFGIASSAHYQGGEFTVIVAHYGKTATSSVPKTTKPKATPKATTPKAVAPAATPTPAPTPAPTPTPTETPVAEPAAQPPELAPGQPKKVSNLEAVLGGQATWAVYTSLGLVGLTSVGFAGTHWRLVKHGWRDSKHFILVHPALDTAVIAAVAAMVLTSASGFIK